VLIVSTAVRFAGDSRVWNDEIDLSSTIIISNHTGYADWLAIYWLALRRGGHGAIRWVVKAAAVQIPVIGWAMKAHEVTDMMTSHN
jgi:1-acyl-sn-glycerol-3-phosphate acyltransferase